MLSGKERKRWTAAEDRQLLAMRQTDMTFRAIGQQLGRSENSIQSRLRVLAREARLAELLRPREERPTR